MENSEKEIVASLARGITSKTLAKFYADPANVAAFEKWKAERDQHDNRND